MANLRFQEQATSHLESVPCPGIPRERVYFVAADRAQRGAHQRLLCARLFNKHLVDVVPPLQLLQLHEAVRVHVDEREHVDDALCEVALREPFLWRDPVLLSFTHAQVLRRHRAGVRHGPGVERGALPEAHALCVAWLHLLVVVVLRLWRRRRGLARGGREVCGARQEARGNLRAGGEVRRGGSTRGAAVGTCSAVHNRRECERARRLAREAARTR